MGRQSKKNFKELNGCIKSSPNELKSSNKLVKEDGRISYLKSSSHLLILIAVVVLSFATRFYDIHKPDHVCWDETHFGKMASWYINRTFFFDVHPPLGKMLIALSGQLSGYDGLFPYEKPGDKYDNWTQYVGMRVFCALLGFAIPIIILRSVYALTGSRFSSAIAAFLIVFDNGTITLTRYILLDSPLLFFISTSILGLCEFSFRIGRCRDDKSIFSKVWWFWLGWTGVSIACAFSVKFVGLFIVSLVGLRTCYDLWKILGDLSKPFNYFVKHFIARALCLILLPAALYITFFWIHLEILNHSGNGDGFYSSSFQSRLIGNSLHNSSSPSHLAYGAQVTLKNTRIGGAYLHSHWHLYPEGVGAKQQQVTTYSHKDSNNMWLIKRGFQDPKSKDEFVHDGDLVLLEHITTSRNLHSHPEPAPITKRHFQVTCYGENGKGDANDIWTIVKDYSGLSNLDAGDDRILTVKSRFRLIHHLTNCALHSHSKQLPKWAYEQLEVTCNPNLYDTNNYWNIEDNRYDKLPNVSFEQFAPSFLERFIESHAVMLQGNAGLKPKEGEVTSRPWQWPLNYRGQFFSASKDHKIYLLGNPSVWWSNIIAIPITLVTLLFIAIRNKLKASATDTKPNTDSPSLAKSTQAPFNELNSNYLETSLWIMLGWLLHYLPFYFMGRILYFHHYFPAFIFNCMQTAITVDYLTSILCMKLFPASNINKRKIEIFLIYVSLILYTFNKFIPLTYGTKEELSDQIDSIEKSRSERHLASLKWLDSWEF